MSASKPSIDALIGALTLEEKCMLLAGKNMWETLNVDRLGIRSLKMTDGPAGVRGATWTDGTHTTMIPCGISLAATFDSDLVERIGRVLGTEARSKNAHILLAPTMNMSRSPLGGRNFENFGEDPYLTGRMASSYVKGVQSQGVGACVKHYVANDQETRRFNMDQQIDERALREIYLRPFQMTMETDPWTLMTAYPKINGEHADVNQFLMCDILRDEWKYTGMTVSDWGGMNDTIGSIQAGSDLEMPGPAIRYGPALLEAVKAGRVSEKHVDASVKRLLELLDRVSLLGEGDSSDHADEEKNSDLPECRQTARDAASGSIVLLKNESQVLPLNPKKMKKLAVIGPNAKKPTVGGTGSAAVNPYYITTPFESISKAALATSDMLEIQYSQGIYTNLQPPLPGGQLKTPDGAKVGVQVDFYAGHAFEGDVVSSSHWQNSVLFMMSDGDTPESLRGKPHCYRVRGVLEPAMSGVYDFSLSSTGKAKLFIDNALLVDNSEWTQTGGTFMNCGSVNKLQSLELETGRKYDFRIDNVVVPPPLTPHDNTLFHTVSGVRVGMQLREDEQAMFDEALEIAKDADAVVLVVGHNNDTEKEGIDRTSLTLPRRTDELVSAICGANANTVVVTQSACAIAMPWAGEAPAVVHAWYQGQENGNGIADVLFGKVCPSGKLPITFPKRLEDHGSHKWFPGDADRDYSEYGEGVLVGYRWFDAQDIEPLWSFGHGLSYTKFEISNVQVEGHIAADGSSCASIVADIGNVGEYDGAEVVQVYVNPSPAIKELGRPSAPRALAAFAKVAVPQKQSRSVRIEVRSQAFAWFDVAGKGGRGSGGRWRVDKGTYRCYVGTGSRAMSSELDVEVT
ncbi:beta-glucosidase B [Xylariaceae sp. FL0016]|nr:beta-glucosidase B [Xylariaceae sp. FL0016]